MNLICYDINSKNAEKNEIQIKYFSNDLQQAKKREIEEKTFFFLSVIRMHRLSRLSRHRQHHDLDLDHDHDYRHLH